MTVSLEQLAAACSEDVRELNPDIFAAPANPGRPAKANKYNARKTIFDGQTFDSAKEARRYQHLLFLQSTHEIANLRRQVKYTLQEAITDNEGKRQRAITYSADFVYEQGGVTVIEDVKSAATKRTESFRVRWRLLLAQFKDNPTVKCVIYT